MAVQVTLSGNLVADPELRFTQNRGLPTSRFRVASTLRRWNRETGDYEDVDTTFLTVVLWNRAAENAAETLKKGMTVLVSGRLRQRQYEDKDGNRRNVFEVVDAKVAVDLHTQQVTGIKRNSGNGAPSAPNQGQASASATQPPAAPPAAPQSPPQPGSVPTPGRGDILDTDLF